MTDDVADGTQQYERSSPSAAPGVLAVLVAHDGRAWLPEVLAAIEQQTYGPLEVLAVDNGSSDGSREFLLAELGEQRVFVAERDLGFAAAVSMALDSAAAARSEATWVLLLHDDLIPDADMVERLVAHGEADPRVAVVGPKLVRHDDPRLLQQVGVSIDLTGRADTGLESDELDQGQRDRVRPVLYLSTAGMLVRRDVLEDLGRLDRRYHVFRDDLDLCWRAWLAGHDVEVVPDAVGRHVRAVSNYERLGQTAAIGPRYFAERNTLATLLKCYGPARLAVVVPLFLIVGVAKVLGFIATRRINDAWLTVRAWSWNLAHLRETLRLRGPVQEARVRSDAELAPLFTRIAPRLRAYAEAVADRLAGGDEEVPAPVEEDEDAAGPRVVEFVRQHPVFVGASALLVLGLVVAVPFLRAGAIRGGDFAPWPSSPLAFLRTYASGWHDAGGMGTSASPSPAQALLGLFGIVTLGNEWLAPRLLLFGALPVAWLLALRAGSLVAGSRVPRVVAATAYTLSPPALAALIDGRLGALVALAGLPALTLLGVRLVDVQRPPPNAWRATAAAAIVGAILVAFEPPTLLLLLAAVAVGLVAISAVRAPATDRRAASLRLLLAAVGAAVLLIPWSVELLGPDSPVLGGFSDPSASASPFVRWLLLVPGLDAFPGPIVGVAFPAAGALGLLLGYRRQPVVVGTLWTIVVVAAAAAWGLGRAGSDAIMWPGLLLLVAALAYSALLAVAFTSAGEYLRAHAFGWRQVASFVAGTAVAVGGLGAVAHLVTAPWDDYAVGQPALPTFLGTEQDVEGPYRVLILSDEGDGIVWDLTGPAGPTMVRYGMPPSPALTELVDGAVQDAAAQVTPAAGARLGVANILYVYVPEGGRSERLTTLLGEQFDLEPLPVATGAVYRVRRWLPRAAFLDPGAAVAVARRGELPPDVRPLPIEQVGEDEYAGRVPGAGAVLLAEPLDDGWVARGGGRLFQSRPGDGLVRFVVPAGVDRVEVTFGRQTRRSVAVALQVFLVLTALSLVLRPPSFAEQHPRPRVTP